MPTAEGERSRAQRDPVLVLSGGGSLGAAQVGLLRPFYRAGFRPAAIVGTSVGAINGAFLAYHQEPEALELLRQAWLSIGAREIFSLNPFRLVRNFVSQRNCFFDNGVLRRLLKQYLPVDDFALLRVPFYAVATNLSRGTKAVFHEGPLYPAILASAAIPGVLCPIRIAGDVYVDGGVLAGLDLATAVGLGSRNILAVDVSLCEVGSIPWDVFHIWRRCSDLTMRQQVQGDLQRFAGQTNIAYVCPPRRPDVSPQDFGHTSTLIDKAEAYGEQMAALLLDGSGRLRQPTPPRGLAA